MFIFLNKSTLDIPYTHIFEISVYYKSMHAFKTHFIIINELHFESPFFYSPCSSGKASVYQKYSNGQRCGDKYGSLVPCDGL